jgi:hypothetical protein
MNIIETMEDPELFQPWFSGASWDGWRTILKAAFALPMTEDERAFFRSVADREPPARQVRELWIIAGRRAGKDSVARRGGVDEFVPVGSRPFGLAGDFR